VRSVNLDSDRLGWNTSLSVTTNDPVVTQLSDGGAFFVPESFNIVRVAANEAPGHFFGTTYRRDDQGRIVNAAGVPVVNDAGDVVGIPAVGTSRIIGDPNPDMFWTLTNEVTVGRSLAFRVQLDAVQGQDVFNFDRRLLETPAFGSGVEYGRELTGEYPRGYFTARRGIFEEYIEDGSFIKLRELSASYTFDMPAVRRVFRDGIDVTLSGRNLWVWTDYSGYDPEINLFGTNAGGIGSVQTTAADRGFDFGGYPIPRVWAISARFTY
jgi:TonB-dependent starch-binding outer membrane protein SusC